MRPLNPGIRPGSCAIRERTARDTRDRIAFVRDSQQVRPRAFLAHPVHPVHAPPVIEWATGDLFAADDLPGLAHGCNCAGAMGAGIAVEFKRRWPDMYEAYRRLCAEGRFQPGDVFVWEAPDRVVFNLGTQRTWRTKATLEAIEASLRRTLELAAEKGVARIGVPRIGAGLGGLPWADVRAVLERVAADAPTTLVVFETYVAAGPTRPARPRTRGDR